MSSTPATPAMGGNSTPPGYSHHHRRRRLNYFRLPDGKKVHIALSPEEAESLRQRLNVISKDEPFDLVISGSPEHLDALRQAHSHHEKRREALRQNYGQTYDEFENVRAELDALADELHAMTDHVVALDANFSKYGYSAHIRTYGGASTPGSSRLSMSGGSFHDQDHEKDWEAERRNGRIMKLYKKPVIRQYFHQGLLWRGSGLAEVASFELFVDLLYVGILAINGDRASENITGYELHRFCITFIMSWRIWSDLTLIISWFETDDILQRITILYIMACLLGLTTNMLEAFSETYRQLVAFYLAARLFIAAYFLLLARVVPIVRGMMILQAINILIPSILWIASIYVEMPRRLALIWVAIFFDLCASMFIMFVIRGAKLLSKGVQDWAGRVFEFYPAMNIEHRVERTNAFVTLVFGYAVVGIIYQSAASFGINAFYGKAVLGLIQSFCFNWIYFEIDGADLFSHAIRRNRITAIIWSSVHIPFVMAFVLAAAALSKMVVASDCPNALVEALTQLYAEKSEHEIPIALRWFYCGGLGIALICMGIISASHIHKEVGGTRLNKHYRLVNRLGVAIIIFCLPLAPGLNSLQLVSVVTGLIVWVLLLELWGASCPKESFFGEKTSCDYTAKCKISNKDIEAAVRRGDFVHVKDLASQDEEGIYELS